MSLPRRSLLDDGELFPPAEESFLEKYLEMTREDSGSEDQKTTQEERSVSLIWDQVWLDSGRHEKRKEWQQAALVNFQSELRVYSDDVKPMDGRMILHSRITDPDGHFTSELEKHIKETNEAAAKGVQLREI